MKWKWYVTWIVLSGVHYTTRGQFYECQDDPSDDPEEGPLRDMRFTWLGVLQYIHVKNGTPHFFRLPRVTLISRQFVISTATDAALVPEGYALGNVAFGEYERDEVECGLTLEMVSSGAQCSSGVLLMPLAGVLLHPEYKHFGARDSIALLKLLKPISSKCGLTLEMVLSGAQCSSGVLLMPLAGVLLHPEYKHFGARDSIALLKLLKPISSRYMLPVCLPFKDYVVTKPGRQTSERFYHIDFVNDVPRDIVEEDKEVTKLSLLPRELCHLYTVGDNRTELTKNRIMCTTGCGFHSGAPSIYHEHTGHWSLIAISQGGSPCPDPLRVRRPPPPPHHIYIYPYVPWITTAITGKAVGAFAKDDPFGFVMPRSSQYDLLKQAWSGHWWMGGYRCFDRGEAADDLFKFYHEVFQIKPTGRTNLNYFLEIYAPAEAMVVCIKVGMPYRLDRPYVWDLDSAEVKVLVPLIKFQHTYKFQVEAWAYNASFSDGTESETSVTAESSAYS